MQPQENSQQAVQKALLIGLDTGEYDAQASLAELETLAVSAGAEVEGVLLQRRPAPEAATVIGQGKLEEAAEFCKVQEIDLALFDCELSPAQMRNIEQVLHTAVIDRTALILDIFARRAVTAEGKLQVELAQLQYRLPRLSGIGTALSRLGGGIGTRGPGETQLETDRRHIHRRIAALKKELGQLEKRRALHRQRRQKEGVISIAIVGYTNVGKSTLLNALTGAGVLAENRLCATLDPTSRGLELPDGRNVMLIDTVGFVRRLPHHLVEAFHSTLEEAVEADLIWCVCDASSEEAEAQAAVAKKLLAELEARAPVLIVLNKCDTALPAPGSFFGEHTVNISARTGEGLESLLRKTTEMLEPAHQRMQLYLPYGKERLLAEIRQEGRIYHMDYEPEGMRIDALVEKRLIPKAAPYDARGQSLS